MKKCEIKQYDIEFVLKCFLYSISIASYEVIH